MGIYARVAAPLALSFFVATSSAHANTPPPQLDTNDHNATALFQCDRPEMSGLMLPVILSEIMPANVFIKTSALAEAPEPVEGEELDPAVELPPKNSLGSGFIVNPDGYILTNHHVIEGATEVNIVFYDPEAIGHEGKSVEATIIGSDDKLDLAVLKVEMDAPLPCVNLGDSDAVLRGESVYPIGNPLGKPFRASAGIVSHPAEEVSNPLYSYIGTDAAINRGNSGGGLFDASGEVVGMNTLILSPNGGNIGVGYATKSNDIRYVAEQIFATGSVARAGLGVQIADVPEDMAEQYGLEDGVGVLVKGVSEGRPASLAGIVGNDIILEINGSLVTSTTKLVRTISSFKPDDTIDVKLMRDGDVRTLSVLLTGRDAAIEAFIQEPVEPSPEGDALPELQPWPETMPRPQPRPESLIP